MFACHDKKINHKFKLFTDFSNLISPRQIVAGQEEVKDICGSNPSYITRIQLQLQLQVLEHC